MLGITLVALIITIIILIILAAVTINSLTHDGLADLAIKSAESYDKAQVYEMEKLNEIDTMVKETVKSLEDGTTYPSYTPSLPTISQTIDETKEIVDSNIGKIVAFTPKVNQIYNTENGDWTETKNDSTNYPEYSGNKFQYFTSGTTGTNGDLAAGWQIWSTDDNYIYIISTSPTSKDLLLLGALGYNNGVTLLDNICDNTFTDKTTYPGSKGQNLKLEQVLAVKSSSVLNAHESEYGTQPYTYTFAYPYIWNEYEKSDINQNQSSKDWENNRSKAYNLTTTGGIASTINYKPYYSFWVTIKMNTESAWISSNYYELVMSPAQSKTYWLSSRYAMPSSESSCFFSLLVMLSSGVNGGSQYLYNYNRNSTDKINVGGASRAVRPMVMFPISDYALDNSGDTIKIVKRG